MWARFGMAETPKTKNIPAVSDSAMAVEQLCRHCALCCNGVIFADVELQECDDASRLRALGLPLERDGRKIKFRQPCAGLDGRLCRLYDERPKRCRTFDCRLLQNVIAGKVRITDARSIINETLKHAGTIRRLLRRLGQRDETLPLSIRYRMAMQEPLDLSAGPEQERLRGRLMLAVYELTQRLEKDFLT